MSGNQENDRYYEIVFVSSEDQEKASSVIPASAYVSPFKLLVDVHAMAQDIAKAHLADIGIAANFDQSSLGDDVLDDWESDCPHDEPMVP